MNIPNALTLLRIVLIPVMVAVFYMLDHSAGLYAALIFAIAGFTDWVDGYLARRLGQTTPFGAFLDPVADKLIVAVALVLLVEVYGAWWFSLPACVIIGREIVISALREWMAELGQRASVAVSMVGKVKTAAQMLAITALLLAQSMPTPFWFWSGVLLLYIAALLTLWSMIVYLRAAWPILRGKVD